MGRRSATRTHVGEALGEHVRREEPAPATERDARRDGARAFLRWHATKIVAGGLAPALFDMTLAARIQAIDAAAASATLDEPVRFELRDAGVSDGAYAFDVTYVDEDHRRVTLRECVAETDAGWRIVSVA
ncbi:MAG TPA: hypothetical protein VNM91_11300 [Dehalococcoidia bacterium]|nr:hypothetical protein [Dehalococcoidia bacterium]